MEYMVQILHPLNGNYMYHLLEQSVLLHFEWVWCDSQRK